MKNSCKKITAFVLSLALIAGNAGNFLPGSNALTAKAAGSLIYTPELPGEDESYYDAETETLHLKGYVRNSADGSGLVLPDGVSRKDIYNVVADEGTVFPENCSYLFQSLGSVPTIDLRNADTSNVTDMSYMFCGSENDDYFSREFFDISTFDTSKVTNMEGMFMNFSGFYHYPDRFFEIFANFDTSSVTNMSKMFKNAGCANLLPEHYQETENDKPTFSSFDTSKVTDMSEMFADIKINELNLTNFDTSNVTTMSRMFKGSWYLMKLDISTFDTSNVTDMTEMFSEMQNWVQGGGPDKIDLSSFNTSKVTDMSKMFYRSTFYELDLSSFDTSNVTDMSGMFGSCLNLHTLDVSNFDTSKVTDMAGMFSCIGVNKLDIRNFIIPDDTKIDHLFAHMSTKYGGALEYVTLPYGWTEEKMNEKGEDVFFCLSGGPIIVSEAPDESYYDAETETLHLKGYIRNSADGSGIVRPEGITGMIKHLVADEGTVLPPDCSHFCEGLTTLDTIDLKNADTSHVTDMSYMFVLSSNSEFSAPNSIDVSNFDTSNVTNMEGMFMRCGDSKLDLKSFDTSKVTNMSWMFYELYGEALDLSNFDTSNVTNMSGMFFYTFMNSVDLSSFDTGNVTDMSMMFSNSNFKELDLSSFDTSKVTNIHRIFYNCYRLETIYVSDKWTTDGVSDGHIIPSFEEPADHYMFYDCRFLSGGKGTGYDPDIVDSEYARIDEGTKAPGYLTSIDDKYDRSYFDKETKTLHLRGNITNHQGMDGGVAIPYGTDPLDVEHIVAEPGTVLPEMCDYFCLGLTNLRSVDLRNADTSNVTNMGGMFITSENTTDTNQLTSIDLRGIDTSNVYNMAGMFSRCAVRELDLSSFDTSNVAYMRNMFERCVNLRTVDVSSFDTSNVTDMESMFSRCHLLKNVDVSRFDTSKVENMAYMFFYDMSLTGLDVSSFDTKNVTNMKWMFACTSIQSLDLSKFDTSNVTNMQAMFDHMAKIKTLDISSFNTKKVTDMRYMFYECYELENITIGQNWSTQNVKNGVHMFFDCKKLKGGAGTEYDPQNIGVNYARNDGGKTAPGYLTLLINASESSYYDPTASTLHLRGSIKNSGDGSGIILPDGVTKEEVKYIIADKGTVLPADSSNLFSEFSALRSADLKNADTSKVTDMSYMFYNCVKVSSIDVSSFDTSNVTNMSNMFCRCHLLKSIDVSSFNTSKVTDMSYMFFYDMSLKALDVSSFDTKNVTNMKWMFACTSIQSLDLSRFNTSKVTNMQAMFDHMANIRILDISSFDTKNVTDMRYMFYECYELETIKLGSGWSTKNTQNGTHMFYECRKLTGSAGTAYNSKNIGLDYARIDGGTNAPGYGTEG